MQDPDFISLFVAPLEKSGIRYLITGSVASSIYGEPRNTLDIDLVVLIQQDQIPLLAKLFPDEDFYLPPADVIAIEARREAHGHFNVIHHHTGLKADIYLSRNHPSLPWALENARRVNTATCEISIAPPEYVILHKLEFFREGGSQKHLRDIAGMIEQQELDQQFLGYAITQLHLEPQFQAAQALTDRGL
jgi:hypothetical protein